MEINSKTSKENLAILGIRMNFWGWKQNSKEERVDWKRLILLWGIALLLCKKKKLTALAKWPTLLYTWPFLFRPTLENKKLLHNDSYYLHMTLAIHIWPFINDLFVHEWLLLFILRLFLSMSFFFCFPRIFIQFGHLVWHYLLLDILNKYGWGIFVQ